MTQKQREYVNIALWLIQERVNNNELLKAATTAKMLGGIMEMYAKNGKTKVWKKKSGEILKKYKKSK